MSGAVVWLTGLPSSGKSTLARAIAARLRDDRPSTSVVVLDGDEVRAALVPAPAYDDAGRAAFYETLARLASTLAAQGVLVLVPATANLRAYRARARELAGAFVEVFVDTPLAECRRRDAKGLYAANAATLPGAGVAYEPPTSPDAVVAPDDDTAVERVAGLALRAGNSS